MFTLFLAVLSIYGFLASAIIHVLTFFHSGDLISSLILFAAAMLMVVPTFFIYPGTLPPYDRSFRANHNFWRLIPQKWVSVLSYVGIYCIGMSMFTMFFYNRDGFLPMPYSERMVSSISMLLYSYHFLGYWYHSPLEARKKLISALHPKKKHHRKHD